MNMQIHKSRDSITGGDSIFHENESKRKENDESKIDQSQQISRSVLHGNESVMLPLLTSQHQTLSSQHEKPKELPRQASKLTTNFSSSRQPHIFETQPQSVRKSQSKFLKKNKLYQLKTSNIKTDDQKHTDQAPRLPILGRQMNMPMQFKYFTEREKKLF
jgi:hypothetical protein